MRRRGARFETVTADNGTEFHGYGRIERRAGVVFYFARPYHSWERGSNENANGLLRQYLPKGQCMGGGLSQQQCNAIAKKLNTRPRKRLGFRTPQECFNESQSVLHFKLDVRCHRPWTKAFGRFFAR